MKTASVLLRNAPGYRYQTFLHGLTAQGYKISATPSMNPDPSDVLVIWNRYSRHEHYARMYENAGAKVIVAENGYIGKTKALSLSHHNGAGSWVIGEGDRWSQLDIEIKPWRSEGKHILVLPQRGIGEQGIAMPRNWLQNTLKKISEHTDRPIKIRQHPGQSPCRPIEEDFENAWAAYTWGSGAGIKAICAGIPVFNEFAKWIGSPAASQNLDLENPFLGDRLSMLNRLAWAQFTMDEIDSGFAFEVLLT